MEKVNLPEGGRQQQEIGLGEQAWLGQASLLDSRESPREIEDIPGLDICCIYANTDICGMCGAC